jgi:hypothetical protein
MKKNIFFVAAALIAVSSFLFAFFKLQAQGTPPGLLIVPSNLEIIINPGEETTKKVTLYNNDNKDVDIIPETRNFTAQGEEGNVTLTSSETGFSLASWMTITPTKATIKAHKSQEFTILMKVPKNAEAGGHFGSVVLSTVPPPPGSLKETGAFVVQQIGALILTKIPGMVNEAAKLESFTTDKSFYMSGPVAFTARVKNNSNVHIRPAGTVTIKDLFGNKTVIQVEEKNVLPSAIRKIPANWNSKFLIGRYTADLALYYGSADKNLNSSIIFYAFPVKEGLIALAILLLIFFFRKRFFKAIKVIIIGK